MAATGSADVDATINGEKLPVSVPDLTVPKQQIPASGTMAITMTGRLPSLIGHQPGSVVVAVGEKFNAQAILLKADGTPTPLGNSVNVPCTQDPGQNPSMVTIPVSGTR